MADIDEVAENIYLIDAQLHSIPKWGGVYLVNEERKALIDTGPTASVRFVLDGIRKVGVRPEDIDYLVVTHIHLDHAGGAGVLLNEMPQAQNLSHCTPPRPNHLMIVLSQRQVGQLGLFRG